MYDSMLPPSMNPSDGSSFLSLAKLPNPAHGFALLSAPPKIGNHHSAGNENKINSTIIYHKDATALNDIGKR
jgi:hypothetical protein